MRRIIPILAVAAMAPLLSGAGGSGGCAPEQSSNDIQRERQMADTVEGARSVGVPAIVNFREMRQLKDIYELRDQEGLVTYTYTFSEVTGKPSFLCDSIGYGMPYATQFTAGESEQRYVLPAAKNVGPNYGYDKLPQSEPNGLFPPGSADGTWVMCKEPGSGKVLPQYIEPKVIVTTYKLQQAN